MFTGIVTAIGTITKRRGPGRHACRRGLPLDPAGIDIGASIACSGVCLTVVEKGGKEGDAWFAVDVSGETVARTAQDQWRADRRLNLEPALRLGDELGGHLVTGHVDLGRSGRAGRGYRRVDAARNPRRAGHCALRCGKGIDHRRRRFADRQRYRGRGEWRCALRAQHHPAHGRSDHAGRPVRRRCGQSRDRRARALPQADASSAG